MAIAPRTNSVAYQSAIRSPNPPRSVGPERTRNGESKGSDTEDVPHAANRLQQLALERAIDLLAQAAHQHVDDVGLRVEVVFPHVRQDHRLRDDLSGVAHQVLEQRELARPELDGLAAANHPARQQIELEVVQPQR